MVRKHLWLWVTLFILAIIILVVLATGWNLVLVRDYQRFVALARTLSHQGEPETVPWLSLIWGSVGFLLAVAMLVLFFVRLLQEMRLNQQQSEFLASVTHAFKTPIATMELSASMLKEGGVSEEERARLWHSHEVELQRLKDEVETLLEAARWQADANAVKRSFVRLEDWLAESLVRWHRILGHDGRLRREGDRFDFEAWVDPLLLNMATDNLLENARKFAQDIPKVTIRTSVIGKYWQIDFRDEGWGFEPADAQKIFRRFFRARNLAPRAIPGTGLGLYLARSACKRMGIRMAAKSEGRGLGAQFSMTGRIRRDEASAHG